jgi:hypothetical protein
MLRAIQEEGRCEIGAHLHPWCTPPLDDTPLDDTEASRSTDSFLCNLPVDLQRAKLEKLTDAIAERVGRRPTSFRAGRYGLDAAGARILTELGYEVDSSVIPFTDYSTQGGPDFRRAPFQPYYASDSDLCEPQRGRDSFFGSDTYSGTVQPNGSDPEKHSRPLLEVPVSVGFHRSNFRRNQRIYEWTERPVPRKLHARGILDRLGIVRRIKFSPEQATAPEMQMLVDAYLAEHAVCMVMMFHSSSLVPGGSPYVRDEADLRGFFATLREVFQYCCRERGMKPYGLTEFARSYSKATCPAPLLAGAG